MKYLKQVPMIPLLALCFGAAVFGSASNAQADIYGDLIVDNHSHSELFIYVNGREVGHVHSHSQRTFHVHHAHYVTAKDRYGHRWHTHFDRHYHRLRWIIRAPHHSH